MMKTLSAVVVSSLLLMSCGISAKNKSSSAVKDTAAANADYTCRVSSTLDGSVPHPVENHYEVFDFKASDTSISKLVGVTSGDNFAALVNREVNSVGARINLTIGNMATKATSASQFAEGSDNLLLTATPDGKFQVTIYCVKK
jgi:hypothetical protein